MELTGAIIQHVRSRVDVAEAKLHIDRVVAGAFVTVSADHDRNRRPDREDGRGVVSGIDRSRGI